MKKIGFLSIVASSVLITNVCALDINLKAGWNAVGISSAGDYDISTIVDTSKVESIIAYNGNIIESYDPLKPTYSDFTTLTAGKGYWVKVKSDTVLNIGDTPISLSTVTFNIGWNLLGIPSMNIADISTELSAKDMKIDSVITYNGSIIESYDPLKPSYSDFSSTVNGKGYWFKISKKLTPVPIPTLDGYTVTLYSSTSETVSASLVDTIKSSTLNELTSVPDWENVTSVVLGSGDNEKEYTPATLSSLSDDDIANLKDELAGTAVASASLYIYGVSEGSAPYALVDALVYKVESDDTTTLVGTTDISGFITAPTLISGTKLLIKKDGMADKIYTIDVAGTNYIFMTEDNALELPEEKAPTTTTTSGRVLDYISETFKLKDNIGYYSPSSSDSLKKDLPVRRIKPAPVDTLDESDKLKSLIDSKAKEGYKSDVLASFDFYLKISRRLGGKGYGDFSDYYPTEPYITIALPGTDKYEIDDALAGSGGEIRVFYFDGTEWREKASPSITLKTVNDETTKIKTGYARKFDLSTPVLELKGTGFYPHVIVLDKKVSFTYPVKFHITDSSDANLSDAAVFIGDRLIGTTDANGYVDYNITAGYGDVNFHVKAMKTDYKSADKTVYISSLTEGSDTTVNLKLEKISTTASIEGFVYDTNETNPVYLSKVDLYFPYALAYVKADVYKDGKLGVEVGNQPNTKYKWYMKIHEDAVPTTGVARISKDRWLLVKEGSSSDNGNFLSYQDMKRMVAETKDSTDPEDVKSMVSGLFDIAVIAEHDIDGDGSPDLVELSATEDKASTDFTSTYASDVEIDNYAKIVGTVKFNFDVDKFAGSATIDSDIAPAVKVDGVWGYGSYDADDTTTYYNNVKYVDNGINGDPAADDAAFKVLLTTDYFKYDGLDETAIQANGDFILNYGTAVIADLTTSSTTGTKTVVLVKSDTGYSWKLLDIVNDYELYAKLYDMNASMTIGQKVWDSTTHSYTVFDGKIPYSKISKFISQNEIMEKLNMTLSQIADEAGASDDVKSAVASSGDADKPLISTGMTIVPMVDLHAKNDAGKDIILVEGETLQQGAIADITNYILTGDVNVNPPVSAPRVLVDSTDRSGKFIFSKLPLEYAKLGDKDISMLTLGASKYGHYDSPVINVAEYSAGKVENIKINLKSKGIATVNVEVKDADTNASIDANITIDGQYKEVTSVIDDFKEYSSLESKIGSKIAFDDIISGLRTITVTADGYYPQAISKTVYKDNENNVTVYLKPATGIDDVIEPSIGLVSFVPDEINGIIKLELVGLDKEDGTLKKLADGSFASEVVVYDNGDRIYPRVTMNSDGTIEVIIDTPKIGENEIVVKLINPKGERATSPIVIDFYPTMGAIKGSVADFIDDNHDSVIDDGYFVVVDLYDDKMNYIESVMTDKAGSFMFPMAPVGSVYAKAILIDEKYGTIKKESDYTNVVVAVGSIKKVNLALKDKSGDTSMWIPEVDFDPAISEDSLESEAEARSGTVTIKGKVNHYDPAGQLMVIVNYTPYLLNESDISTEDTTDGSYNFTKDVNLSRGLNQIFVKALNPSGFYDTTPILEVNYGKAENYMLHLSVKDDSNATIPYAYVSIINPMSGIYMSEDTNESGEVKVEIPYTDTAYEIDVFAPGYISSPVYLSDLIEADNADGVEDKNITLNINLFSDTYIPDWYIESVEYTQDLSFEVPYGVVVVSEPVTFTVKPSDEATHTYNVIVRNELGEEILNTTTTGALTHTFSEVGNYEIEFKDEEGTISPYIIYINVAGLDEVLPEPPVAPVIPTPSIGL
ncbi:hypothetical protein [Hydrogenimonas thermophila]|uniref:Uncharacterized protein n=1 Tax=Hydrogenimonas thermophila TaxID=223786 RepID=A0A1I5KRV8_9BACT|nr:hypothetical protein [Hydrogenimonas thermophila]SFO87662.1 hypothetical protein SAMN05216234_10154 [Hydrogenimonas thermophila]